MKIRGIAAAFLLAGAALAQTDDTSPPAEAAATVVLYNRNDPASLALAKYYAGKRGIPADNLVGLDCPKEEEISRDEYLVKIEAPLRRAFDEHDWWKISLDVGGRRYVEQSTIRFAAIMRGVPMKIRPSAKDSASYIYREFQPGTPLDALIPHNEASVDSELAAMFTLLEDAPAVVRNTYYRRFAHILATPSQGAPLLVCRLDGPSDAIVRGMIDDAIATERRGLWGWAYLDERNIRSGGYVEGDDWLRRTEGLMRDKGIPVISDYAPEVWPEGFPMTDAAVYYGWYEMKVLGPFVKPGFRFLPGAVAVHIYSFSAGTIRDPKASWVGQLLACGAAATAGNVYEPYLTFTVNLDLLQDRLMSGLTLAEAAYAATRGLSWMNVVLGDPLYRPYAVWNSWNDSPEDLSNPWQRYRHLVLSAGGTIEAADALRKFAKESGLSMPLEALAQALAAAGRFDDALATLSDAIRIEKSKPIRFRQTLEQIEILRRAGRKEASLERISEALGTFTTDEQQLTLGQVTLILRPPPPPPSPTSTPRRIKP